MNFFLSERKARLAKLLAMNAPDSITAIECLLVIRAYTGGSRWDSLRFVLRDIARRGETIARSWAELTACRVLGWHAWGAVLDEELDETGMEECCYCEERRASGSITAQCAPRERNCPHVEPWTEQPDPRSELACEERRETPCDAETGRQDATDTIPVTWHTDVENAPKGVGLLVVWNVGDASEALFYWDTAYRNRDGEWLAFDGSFDRILGDSPAAWAYPPSRPSF